MVTLAQPVDLMILGDQDLWDQIKAALTILTVPQETQDLMFELAHRLNVVKAQSMQTVLQPAVTASSTLVGSKVKLEALVKFDGNT